MSAAIESLLQHTQIWRGPSPTRETGNAIASGFPELDARLPGGGWPRGALTELCLSRPAIGELGLLMPALAHLSHENRWIALVGTPHIPYAPAWQGNGLDIARLLWIEVRSLTDQLWAIEQSLRAGSCSAVLAWLSTEPDFKQLRRLQLAAEHGNSWGVLFRSPAAAAQASPAALRIQLEPAAQGLRLELLKRRGAWGGDSVQLPRSAAFQ
jgi:hypothetical protein